MNGPAAIQTALGATKFLLMKYLEDLSDADLFVRPAPAANHIAWQVGHLLNSEIMLMRSQLPDIPYPSLPEGFADTHGPGSTGKDGPGGFLSKVEYLGLFDKVRSATIEAAGKLTDADLDRKTHGKMSVFAPTLGAWLLLVSNHTLMHAGQFTVVRRKLGKPIVI